MGYVKPTLSQLIDQQFADLVALLQDADPTLRNSKIEIFSRVMAGGINGAYSYLEWVMKQLFVQTADPEYVEQWAITKGIPRGEATNAVGSVSISGTNGAVCPIGEALRRSDGKLYHTTEAQTIVAGVAEITVQAFDSGTESICDTGVELSFVSTPTGILSTAVVVSPGIIGAVDQEDDKDFRLRVIEHFQKPARGGSAHDYIFWAKEVSATTHAWTKNIDSTCDSGGLPYYDIELGDVQLFFMIYDDDHPNGIPTNAEKIAIEDHINSVRPLGMGDFTAVIPTFQPQDFTIAATEDTPEVRAEITSQLQAMFRREASPGMTIRLSDIHQAIGKAPSVDWYTLTSPSADITPATPQSIFGLGTITWT